MHSIIHAYLLLLRCPKIHILEPVYIPRALDNQQGDISFNGPTREAALATDNTGKTRERFCKKERKMVNGPGKKKLARKKIVAV